MSSLPLTAEPPTAAEKVDGVTTALHVETPENVVLDYQLAGPSVRAAAYAVDFAVRIGIFMILAIFIGIASAGAFMPLLGVGFLFVLRFVVNWFYYVISEVFFRGKSIGKHAFGIRVIQTRGYPITFWPSCLRNLLRAADALPVMLYGFVFTYGVGFLTMLLTKRSQRLGDLAAGTVVITERSVHLPREPIILERIQPLPRNEILSNYVPSEKTLALIEQFLGRRYVLTHERGHALASVLASCLAERLAFQGDTKLVQKYPMAFLARVYVTFLKRAEDEEEEEFGSFDSSLSGFDLQFGGRR